MGRKKKSFILPLIFLVMLPLLLIAAAVSIGYLSYQKQKATLIEKIEKLSAFNEAEESKKIAAEFKIRYPVVKTTADFKALKAEVDKMVSEKTNIEFPPREMSKRIFAILKKYATARIGEEISFCLEMSKQKNIEDTVTGTYKGKKSEASGIIIIINDERYNMTRINADYHYLFDENVSKLRQEREIAAFKTNYQTEKDAFVKKFKEETENDIYYSSGYSKDAEGNWFADEVLLKRELEKARKIFEKKREKEIRSLKDKVRFLGFIPINVNEQAGKD
ncbi:MAG: hypothetical protein A2017_06720 [Lentisphaerae bacterium GWF2_44_16]|nr:MAG: hypothetical protein A2017_06720 [Lentisphaerae bacterium GWF2_44_16]